MKRIQQLSRHLINQIAAGEVIERPASVIKELVENSIDAGSTRVEVEVSKDCLSLRVSDNGSGIHPDDIELAFSKHATSKIATSEDLFDISTMGFRGEALASIISIALTFSSTSLEIWFSNLSKAASCQKRYLHCCGNTSKTLILLKSI